MADCRCFLVLVVIVTFINNCYADDLGDLESSLLGDDDGKTKTKATTRKCPPFKDLPNVNRFSNETEEDTVVVFDCKKGYERVAGSTTRVCQASLKWSGTDLVCKMVHCPKLTIPLAKPNSTNTVYRTAVAFSCKKGYLQVYGDVTRTCHANKTWSGRDIRCRSNTCIVPNITKVTCGAAPGTKIAVDNAITCSCAAGHKVIGGNRTRTCVKMQQWSGTDLKCQRIPGFQVGKGAKMTNCSGFCQRCGDKILVPGGDVNGDGYADLICHKGSGRIHIALNDKRGGFQCQSNSAQGVEDGWCRGEVHDSAYVADFDGDQHVDLLCHNYRNGHKSLRLRNQTTNSYWSPKPSLLPGWCGGLTQELHVADFDGDGKADFLCHSNTTGAKWLAKGRMPSLPFVQTQYWKMNWCGQSGLLLTADSNGDGTADLYCLHNTVGNLYVAQTVKIDKKSNTAWKTRLNSKGGPMIFPKFCPGNTKAHMRKFHLMDFDGDGTDDVYCHRTETNSTETNCIVLGKAGNFPDKKCRWESKKDYCNHHGDLLIFDKYFGTKRDDILCIRKGRFLLIKNNGP